MRKPFCIKGKKVSTYLIQASHATYPMEDTKYLETLPLWKECYMMITKSKKSNNYKLLRYLFV